MTKDQKARLSRIIGVLCMNSGRDYDKGLIDLWATALLPEMTIEQIEQAAGRHMKLSKFFPAVSEILQQSQGSEDEQAQRALEFCIKHSIFDKSVKFQDQAIAVAIERLGGWQTWCDWVRWMPEEEFHWKRKEWVRHYVTAKKLGEKPTGEWFLGYVEMQGRLAPGYGEPMLQIVGFNGEIEDLKTIGQGVNSFKKLVSENENRNGGKQ